MWLLALVASCLLAGQANADLGITYDLLRDFQINFTWMEIGFLGMTDNYWYNVTSTVMGFREDRNYSVFLSLPEYGGPTYQDGFPMVPKMKAPISRNDDGTLTFEARLIQPNDSACSHEWYVAQPLTENIRMSWLIVQNGVYNISGNMFIVDYDWIGRNNSVLIQDDAPALAHNLVVFNFTAGCDADNPDLICEYDTDASNIGALQQIQTDINKFDNETMWLSSRSRAVFTNRIELLLTPTSTGPDSPYYETYETLDEELLSYFIYEQNIRIRCVEGLHIETKIDYPVTSDALNIDYYFDYDYPPGLFGMIGTLTSVRDTTHLRVFNNTETSAYYITQEDRCYDKEWKHISAERAFTFIIGESSASDVSIVETQCFIIYNSGVPTGEPTRIPTSVPTMQPWGEPSSAPSLCPTGQPSSSPSSYPSFCPSSSPSGQPSQVPTLLPSAEPTGQPTGLPSGVPTMAPSSLPTGQPSGLPSSVPTMAPSAQPTGHPSGNPTKVPSSYPTGQPSCTPTAAPYSGPTMAPVTSIPTGEPSSNPTRIPSGIPSKPPSYNPTSRPTSSPTSMPTVRPTRSPTPRPTAQPTRRPTPIPTSSPTIFPTWASPRNCTFQFLLLDKFGDGWVDMWLNLTTTDVFVLENEEVYSELHQPNCTFKLVSVLSLTCSIEVSMLNGIDSGNGNIDGAITPWENYWQLIHKGTRYVGGADSFLKIRYERLVEFRNPVNYDVDDHVNKCHECKHPAPKRAKELFGDDGNPAHNAKPHPKPGAGGKGKSGPAHGGDSHGESSSHGNDDNDSYGNNDDNDSSGSGYNPNESHDRLPGAGNMPHPKSKPKPKAKPKPPPPYLVQIALYDEVGDGYYDNSGDFDPLYSRSDYSSIDVNTGFPNVLAYPKYYIMTKDRQKLIKSPGSICPERSIEYCEEALPYDGRFVFRFAGFEPWQTDLQEKDESRWRFCGRSGGINEEFEFEMRQGKCYPLTNTLTDEMYCELGFDTAVEFGLTMNVTGAFGDVGMLSEVDTALLEKEVSQLFPSDLKVTVVSVERSSDSSFVVQLKATAVAEQLGYHGNYDDEIEALMSEIPSLVTRFLGDGSLVSALMFDADEKMLSERDPLRSIESVTLLDAKLLGVHFQNPESGGAFALPMDSSKKTHVEVVTSYVPHDKETGAGQLEMSNTIVVGSVVALAGVVAALVMVSSRGFSRFSSSDFNLLPDNSLHLRAEPESNDSLNSDLESCSGKNAHKASASGAQETVHYEDDLDIYRKYLSAKSVL